MKTMMQAAVCTGLETMEIQSVPVPKPGPGEVLVEVKATGLCGSDVDGYVGHHPMIEWPIILGHECSGIIAAVGSGVKEWQPGDAVVVEPFFTCKTCSACKRGQYNLCVDLKIIGHQIPGSLAEYVLAEAGFVHRKPANLSFAEAALSEPVSGALHAVERTGIRLGDQVVVIGCGTIGSLAMQHALNKGAEVMISEPMAFKREAAKNLGVHQVVDPTSESLRDRVQAWTSGVGADCVIEAVGLPETLAETVKLVRRGGTVMLIGWSGQESDAIDLTTVTLDELTLLGTLGFCHDYPTSLKLMGQNKVTVAPLLTHRLPLTQVERGLQMLKNHEAGVWKIAITSEEVV